MELKKYHNQKTNPEKVIQVNGGARNGFVEIVKNHYRGMTKIKDEILKSDFEECSKEHFEKFKNHNKLRRGNNE